MKGKAKKKTIVVVSGKNVRFDAKSYDLLKVYCKEKGYRLGAFCEIGALEKMKSEVLKSVTTNNIK